MYFSCFLCVSAKSHHELPGRLAEADLWGFAQLYQLVNNTELLTFQGEEMNKQALRMKLAKSGGLAESWILLKEVLTYSADISRYSFEPEFPVNRSKEIKFEGQVSISHRCELSKEIFICIIGGGKGYLVYVE